MSVAPSRVDIGDRALRGSRRLEPSPIARGSHVPRARARPRRLLALLVVDAPCALSADRPRRGRPGTCPPSAPRATGARRPRRRHARDRDPASPDDGNVDGVALPGADGRARRRRTHPAARSRIRPPRPGASSWRGRRRAAPATGSSIEVETGDVGPLITATEVRDGRVVDEMDLSGFADGTAAAGGCHAHAAGVHRLGRVPPAGRTATAVLGPPLRDRRAPAADRSPAAPAAWPGEPFVLGPWIDTEPFPGARLTTAGRASGRAEAPRSLPGSCWWAGAELNCHSRRRGFYRPLGSPPARPTHGADRVPPCRPGCPLDSRCRSGIDAVVPARGLAGAGSTGAHGTAGDPILATGCPDSHRSHRQGGTCERSTTLPTVGSTCRAADKRQHVVQQRLPARTGSAPTRTRSSTTGWTPLHCGARGARNDVDAGACSLGSSRSLDAVRHAGTSSGTPASREATASAGGAWRPPAGAGSRVLAGRKPRFRRYRHDLRRSGSAEDPDLFAAVGWGSATEVAVFGVDLEIPPARRGDEAPIEGSSGGSDARSLFGLRARTRPARCSARPRR